MLKIYSDSIWLENSEKEFQPDIIFLANCPETYLKILFDIRILRNKSTGKRMYTFAYLQKLYEKHTFLLQGAVDLCRNRTVNFVE